MRRQNLYSHSPAAVLLLSVLAATPAFGGSVGPDSYGYLARDSVAYSFTDIAGTGVAVLAGADDDRALVNLGFTFPFYGRNYTQVCLSSNGLLSFGAESAAACNADFVNLDLSSRAPSGDLPAIAPFWTDLSFAPRGAGAVHYQTLGAAPNRRFIAQWTGAYPLNAAKGVTFQAVLFEAEGRILIQYRDVEIGASAASQGGGATVGIRDFGGATNGRAVQWSYNVPVLRNQTAIEFLAAGLSPVDLGKAGPRYWAALALSSSGGVTASGSAAIVGSAGHVGVVAGGKLTTSGSVSIAGKAFLGTGAVLTQSGRVVIGGGTSQDAAANTLLTQAAADAQSASTSAAQMPPTLPAYNDINLSGGTSLTIVGLPGRNVVNVASLVLNKATLILQAPAGATFLINVAGAFTMSGTSEIRLQGGILPLSVVYNVKGSGSAVSIAAAYPGALPRAQMSGIVLAPQRAVALTPGLIRGTVIASGLTVSGEARIENPF